jgi:hypothetical protein
MTSKIVEKFKKEFNKLDFENKEITINQINDFIGEYNKKNQNEKIKKFLIGQKNYLIENFHNNEYVIDQIDKKDIGLLKKKISNEFEIISFNFESNNYFNDNLKFSLKIQFTNFIFFFEYDGYNDLKGKIKTNYIFSNELKYDILTSNIIKSLYNSDIYPLLHVVSNDWDIP